MTEYTLTPEQYQSVLSNLPERYRQWSDDTAAVMGGRVYMERSWLVGKLRNDEGQVRGVLDYRRDGIDTEVETHYNAFNGQPQRFVLRTNDPEVEAAIRRATGQHADNPQGRFTEQQMRRLAEDFSSMASMRSTPAQTTSFLMTPAGQQRLQAFVEMMDGMIQKDEGSRQRPH